MAIVSIIIPTFNNPQYLYPCVQSIIQYTMTEDLFHIYVVNNGEAEHMKSFKNNPLITVLQQDKNLGWEGGLDAGIKASKEPFVLFMNDDTLVPPHQRLWLNELLSHFTHPNCAASGPTSNVVMGRQNMFLPLPQSSYQAKFLIGFCMLVRRSDLEEAGGIDLNLPGGDDLDLSIRLRKLGKHLMINREVFIWHHGFKTGERVEGPASKKGGWNSVEKIERTNHALIMKHGLRAWMDLWAEEPSPNPFSSTDVEGDTIRQYVQGATILELGCGDKKTVPESLGIDIIPKGNQIPGVAPGRLSVADKIGDVSGPLPIDPSSCDTIIARHILEHIPNTVEVLRHWREALKHGGRLIIAVPNQNIRNSIPLNYQHVHGFTPQSLKDLMESLGWKTIDLLDPKNNVSFVGVWEKNGATS